MSRIGIAKEGWPYIGALLILTALALLFLAWVAVPLGCLAAFVIYFFRDPERIVTQTDDKVLSPADGTVVSVETVSDPFMGDGAQRIAIFLSLFNVHINRAPISGKVARVKHTAGKFVAAFNENASEVNENNVIEIEGESRVRIKQIAGILARRIICNCRSDDAVAQGERIGMIKFGSRVEITIPSSGRVLVSIGDKVKAGITEMGALK